MAQQSAKEWLTAANNRHAERNTFITLGCCSDSDKLDIPRLDKLFQFYKAVMASATQDGRGGELAWNLLSLRAHGDKQLSVFWRNKKAWTKLRAYIDSAWKGSPIIAHRANGHLIAVYPYED